MPAPASSLRFFLAVTIAAAGAISCTTKDPQNTAAATSRPPSKAPADNAYPGVNSVGYDRGVWQQLLTDAPKIRRSVVYTSTGVQATTESDDPAVIARIKDHAAAMQARMKTGARVRVWDPVFQDLFDHHDAVRLEVTQTENGVRIVEAADSPEVVSLLWSHAAGVSDFVREGHEAGGRATARIPPGVPPAPEVSIGGVRHRILLSQPDAAQLAMLAAAGASEVVNFRHAAEHAAYDESAAAEGQGLRYCSLPYGTAEELTDDPSPPPARFSARQRRTAPRWFCTAAPATAWARGGSPGACSTAASHSSKPSGKPGSCRWSHPRMNGAPVSMFVTTQRVPESIVSLEPDTRGGPLNTAAFVRCNVTPQTGAIMNQGTPGNILNPSVSTFQSEVMESAVPTLIDFWAPWCPPCRALAGVGASRPDLAAHQHRLCQC